MHLDRDIVNKIDYGDGLTDIELAKAITFYKGLGEGLWCMGPRFSLAAAESTRIYDRLCSMQNARLEKHIKRHI